MKNCRSAFLSTAALLSVGGLSLICPAEAQAACNEWTFPASMFLTQSNDTQVIITISPVEGGYSGRANYRRPDKIVERGIIVSGDVDGMIDNANIQLIIHWDRLSNLNGSTGVYNGTVSPQGRMSGTAYDQEHPETKANWFISQLAQCRSTTTAANASPRTGLLLGRVQPLPGQTPGPRPTLCESARSARARNSPAAPGLERQCAAQSRLGGSASGIAAPPAKLLGRVKPSGNLLVRIDRSNQADGRSICEVAADARARNSPAAPGLERQCAQRPADAGTTSTTGAAPVQAEGAAGDVLLSRVYTGGGTNGTVSDDFVELRNRGAAPLDLSGWSLQYASAQGATWQVVPLSGVIEPDRIFLVASRALQPDLIGPMQFAASAGKLALVRSVRAMNGACPLDSAGLVDFLGYGAANCSLGSALPAGTADMAFGRLEDGCTDTQNNAVDFTVGSADALDRGRAIANCQPN